MDMGSVLSVIQTIFTALQCAQLKEMWSIWGYKSDLDELNNIVTTVKKVILGAEAKHDELSQETLHYIEELRDALYDADDLLDEFVTLAKQKQVLGDDKFVKKASLFFSRYNQLSVAFNMSQGVKKIVKKLDGIAGKHSKFGLSLDYKPIRRMRVETCSHPDIEIIGRDEDVEKIVGILVDPDVGRDVSFLTIVGMGGLGKTALTQLVYNHRKIVKEFPLRLWTCVSDHDQSILDVKAVLAQILESATGQKHDVCSLEVVVNGLRETLLQKRFLIILDDLWTESRDEWRKLVGHLVGGERGSHVVVTTRSKETAKIVGTGAMHELNGLSDENSWRLFQLVAFEQMLGQISLDHHVDFINIGKDITRICANVPLAIRVVGGLLYRQHISKWLSFQNLGLANLSRDQNGIMPILKLSYHNLESPLKSCFSYCALYRKDFRISKKQMISYWIAQGYVVPWEKGQSIEDASEEYFSILLDKCFFQDVEKDVEGEVSFKLHDLMHDVAMEVVQKEICVASSFTGSVVKTVRHVSLTREQYASCCFTKNHIRTFLCFGRSNSVAALPGTELLLADFRCLRTLNLSHLGLGTVPASIGKLIHLRYLDLSNNKMEMLPKSITRLYNLQTLDLHDCMSLKELPKYLSKLVNLKVLELKYCDGLTFMPSGIGKLTDLHTLSKFVVWEVNSSQKQHAELEDLKALKKLKGNIELNIHFSESGTFVEDDKIRKGAYIMDKEHLNSISYICKHKGSNEGVTGREEQVLDALQPHANLKTLLLIGYRSLRMPRWAQGDNLAMCLPNLVRLYLIDCSGIQCLPSLGNLYSLKNLYLDMLSNLEYVESKPATAALWDQSSGEVLRFLPCLENLSLWNLPKLKGWCRRTMETVGEDNSISNSDEQHQSSLVLCKLNDLKIVDCPELTSLPQCPNVEILHLYKFNKRLRITTNATTCTKLKEVTIDIMGWLHSALSKESLRSLTFLNLWGDREVESLNDFQEVFSACSSSLKTLMIGGCPKLSSVSGGLGNLAVLDTLHLSHLPKLVNLADEDEVDGMPWGWGSLRHTLHCLRIRKCEEVQSFPKWIRNLVSLQYLDVNLCSEELYERCRNPNGEDWPNIQHVPHFSISLHWPSIS